MPDTASIIRWYVIESGGDIVTFERDRRDGQRVGQSFFNALTREDQAKLRETIHDPFYGGVADVRRAIDFLTI